MEKNEEAPNPRSTQMQFYKIFNLRFKPNQNLVHIKNALGFLTDFKIPFY